MHTAGSAEMVNFGLPGSQPGPVALDQVVFGCYFDIGPGF
jgi:hypothetical protein